MSALARSGSRIEYQDSSVDPGITGLELGNRQQFVERRLDTDESVCGTVDRAPAGAWASNLRRDTDRQRDDAAGCL